MLLFVERPKYRRRSIVGKKNNQTSVSDADRKILTLGSTNNTGNSVNIVSAIIRLPSGWDRRLMINSIYLTYETEFVLFLTVLENLVLPMGRGSSHATLNVTSEP